MKLRPAQVRGRCGAEKAGSGLHVLVPLGRQMTYEQSRNIGYLLALVAVRELEGIATFARLPSQRGGRSTWTTCRTGTGG